jgi:hypothetical protein
MPRISATNFIAIIGAALGWVALALQLGLLIVTIRQQGGTTLLAVWRFVGYFTIWANIAVASLLTWAALSAHHRDKSGNSTAELAVATTIAMVGVVYSVLLRGTGNPQGWGKVADVALHDVMPVIFVVFFLLRSANTLRWRDAAYALILPAVYCAYALARGALDGWYAYPFLDAGKLTAGQFALNATGLGVLVWIMAIVLLGVAKRTDGAAQATPKG